jgi:two-component system response regulator YesN
LITGHNEFEYAQKAVRIGVVDYILKPFEKQELMLTLLRLQDNIIKANEQRMDLDTESVLIQESFLNTLIHQEHLTNEEDIEQKLKLMGIFNHGEVCMVTAIEIDDMDQKWEAVEDRMLWKFAVGNILNEIVEVEGNHIVFNDFEGRIISLIEFSCDKNGQNFEIEAYHKLCTLIKKYLDFTVTIGIGRMYRGIEGVRKSYLEAIASLKHKFRLGNNKVIQYVEMDKPNVDIGFYSAEIHESLLLGLRSNDWENIKITLKKVFDGVRSNNLSIEYTKMIHMGLISLCLSYITQLGKNINDIFGENFFPYNEMNKKETLATQQKWIEQLFEKTINYFSNNKVTRSGKVADGAKEYIHNYYHDQELSVKRIAQHLYINQTYLRTMFKKETGMTVSEYITTVRMNEAKDLLLSGNLRLSNISDAVGYNDASYFSKCFKKYYGISPSEYETWKK